MEQVASAERRQADVEHQLAIVAGMDVLQRPYVSAAYATGSLIAGLGTPTSDLDVILLVDRDEDKERAKSDGAIRRHESVRADFEVFTLAEFTGIVAACADFRTAWDTGRIHRLAQPVRLLSQFTAAARVLKPSMELSALSRRIEEQRAVLIRLSVGRAVNYGNNVHEDVVGLSAVGDEISALRRSHDYLNYGLDAWCTAHGSIYPDDKFKWLWRRLSQLLPDTDELAALRAMYVPELAAGPVPGLVQQRVDTTQALLAQALLTAWAPDSRSWRLPVLPPGPAAGSLLWRSPDWMVTRTPDAWGLGVNLDFYKVPVQAVIAWACSSGRTRDELAAMVTEQSAAAFGLDVEPAAAQALIERLTGRGAVRDAGSSPEARA
jgi:hypothetical protein